MKQSFVLFSLLTALMATPTASAKIILPPRPPVIVVNNLRTDEKPIEITKSESIIVENAYFKRVKVCFTFTNPNARSMAGELEFPIPEGAVVCGYALEIKGEMIPGVVCEKEKARVAFENETRKGVDPGIVEQVKGNLWKTRIFPLESKTPRRAEVEYIAPITDLNTTPTTLVERDGEEYFLATRQDAIAQPNIRESIAHFNKGVILWDASLSAKALATTWRKRLEELPETGEWQLCFFRNTPSNLITITTKVELLTHIDQCVYDGGTHLNAAFGALPQDAVVLLFSDEIDTMGLTSPNYETRPGLIIASRGEAPKYAVEVRKITAEQAASFTATEGKLLATMWAARHMQALASQADQRKEEFLSLGRRYGIAGPGLSLIVLETLEQWIEHDIEPPQHLTLHAEWKRQKATSDDAIAQKKAQAEHEKQLLTYWEERVKWWNDPKPRKQTPKSGLFDGLFTHRRARATESVAAEERVAYATNDFGEDWLAEAPIAQAAPAAVDAIDAEECEGVVKGKNDASTHTTAPAIKLQPWNPKTPYLEALNAAPMGENYAVYLKQRESYADSPAFYLDCASWFFKEHGDAELAERIISNLAEFKLEDAKLWRTMGWRLREAGRYTLAIHVFRKILTLRSEEGQAYRDLAIVLAEAAKRNFASEPQKAKQQIEEAMALLKNATFDLHNRRSGRRGNDFQVAIIALEELNGLITWSEAQVWPTNEKPLIPTFDPAYRRDLPVKLRIVLSWDADETDIDLHVLEPNGEEAYYSHRRTSEGGFVSEDVTTGYGPEEYLKKDLETGTYKILTNYYASHQTSLTGATTVTATIYTDWATANEKQQILTLRLNEPKEKMFIGEVTLE